MAGYPHPSLGWRVPGWGTPILIPGQNGGTPNWNSMAAGGMPTAFMQEDFVVFVFLGFFAVNCNQNFKTPSIFLCYLHPQKLIKIKPVYLNNSRHFRLIRNI